MGPNNQPNQPFGAPPQGGGQQMYPDPSQGPLAPPPNMMHSSVKRKAPVGLIAGLGISVLLLVFALGFGMWAFAGMQDYKMNVDEKVAVGVATAKEAYVAEKDKEYAEKEKSPYKLYQGPAAYGALGITYPKTWSAYVIEDAQKNTAVDGYFHPNFVPGVQSKTGFALRIEVKSTPYATAAKKFESMSKSGKVKVSPYTLPKVPGATGVRVDGEFESGINGSKVVLPLRDKTIEISTLSPQFKGDFDTIILANMTFTP